MKQFKSIDELPKYKWLKIIGSYDAFVDNEVKWFYEELEK